MSAKPISIWLVAAIVAVAGCGDDRDPGVASTTTVSLPAATTAAEAEPAETSTIPSPPPGKPPGPAETATEDPRENARERAAERAVRDYVEALDLRDGARLCALLVPGALSELELPEPRPSCAASIEASIGYRDPRGLPVWDRARATAIRVAELSPDGGSAKVIATVVTRFADREQESVEDDVVYLTFVSTRNMAPQQRRGSAAPRWLVAKPSSTLYRAVGIADVPPSVLAPPN